MTMTAGEVATSTSSIILAIVTGLYIWQTGRMVKSAKVSATAAEEAAVAAQTSAAAAVRTAELTFATVQPDFRLEFRPVMPPSDLLIPAQLELHVDGARVTVTDLILKNLKAYSRGGAEVFLVPPEWAQLDARPELPFPLRPGQPIELAVHLNAPSNAVKKPEQLCWAYVIVRYTIAGGKEEFEYRVETKVAQPRDGSWA